MRLLAVMATAAMALLGFQPAAAALTGPDVSNYQHPNGAGINWQQVRASGQSFAFVKATEGPTGYYENPYFASDWAGARAAGLVRGAYHFARPQYSAADQANFFVSVIGTSNEPGDLAPVLDLEENGGLSPADLSFWTQTFLSTVRSLTGRTPIVYSYPYFWRNSMADTSAFAGYPLWLAQYNGAASPSYPLPGGWSFWTFWQFTSSAFIPGIQGNVDMSNYCCDSVALNFLASQRTCHTENNLASINVSHPSQQLAVAGGDCAMWTHQGSTSGFSSLGGIVRAAPAVVPSNTGGSPFYVATGNDRDLWIRSGTDTWQRLNVGGSVVCIDNPAAVIVNGIFWVGCEGQDQGLWVGTGPVSGGSIPQIPRSSWQGFGGQLVNGPAVTAVGGNPTFFVVGRDRRITYRTPWNGFTSTGWFCNGHPAAATNGATAYFACQGTDRALWYATNAGLGWNGAQSLGGILVDGPGVAAGPLGPTFYAEGQDAAVWERTPSVAWSSDGGMVDFGVGAAYIP